MGKSIWGKIRTRPSHKQHFCSVCIYKSYFHNPKRLQPSALQVPEVEGTLNSSHWGTAPQGVSCPRAQQHLLLQHAQGWKSRKAAGVCPQPLVGPRHVHTVQDDTRMCWQGPAERPAQGGCRIQGTMSPTSGQSCCMKTPLCPLLQSRSSLFKFLQLQPLNLNCFFFFSFFLLIKLFFFLNSLTSNTSPRPPENTLESILQPVNS